MKRLLLLIIAIVLCNPSAYAIIKRIEYKSKGHTYMVVIGNFDKRTLVDGEISITIGTSRIEGKYEKGEIIGIIKDCSNSIPENFPQDGFIVEVQGSISNNQNGGILTTNCNPYDWNCNLRTKATISFDNSGGRRFGPPATATPYETPPINISEESKDSFVSCWDLALQEIKQNIDKRKKKNHYQESYFATITYKGGLIYKGYLTKKYFSDHTFTIPSSQPGVDGDVSNMLEAKLIWSNGDTFEGKVFYGHTFLMPPVGASAPREYEGIMPYRGIIKYHDGQVFEYDKGRQDFSYFNWGDNGLCSPSEMKESFANTIREREEARLREIREEEERKEAELKTEQEKIARKNELIRKYGQEYGEAIFNGEPKMGMTIKMVQDMHQEQGRMSHRISQGREITRLSYGGNYVSFGGISGITSGYEYTFVDGKLIEFSSTDTQLLSITWN